MTIRTKWPAARLRGRSVPVEQALEFIRRTDPFLVGDGHTNERGFERSYRQLSGIVDSFDLRSEGEIDWEDFYARSTRFKDTFGYIELEHLKSHWVASSYICGPFGPVSPSGCVLLACNFGKWPTATEIESDLSKIAAAFPWLSFDLSVWGDADGEDDGMPTDTWHLEGGKWEAVEPKILQVSEPDHITSFFSNFGRSGRELTWNIAQIEKMWGSEISASRAAYEQK